jgi:hypothetical protein
MSTVFSGSRTTAARRCHTTRLNGRGRLPLLPRQLDGQRMMVTKKMAEKRAAKPRARSNVRKARPHDSFVIVLFTFGATHFFHFFVSLQEKSALRGKRGAKMELSKGGGIMAKHVPQATSGPVYQICITFGRILGVPCIRAPKKTCTRPKSRNSSSAIPP